MDSIVKSSLAAHYKSFAYLQFDIDDNHCLLTLDYTGLLETVHIMSCEDLHGGGELQLFLQF